MRFCKKKKRTTYGVQILQHSMFKGRNSFKSDIKLLHMYRTQQQQISQLFEGTLSRVCCSVHLKDTAVSSLPVYINDDPHSSLCDPQTHLHTICVADTHGCGNTEIQFAYQKQKVATGSLLCFSRYNQIR